MAAAPSNEPQNNLTTVLVPVAGVALIVVLIIAIAATSDSPTKPSDKGGTGGPGGGDLVAGAGQPMPSDNSNGGTDDPDLKSIGTEGLKYRDLKEGTGAVCPPGATVTAHYAGWLANGKQFDASRKHGSEPIEFSLSGVVKGWTDGIPGMKVGGIRKLVIPSELGYGARGKGRDIPGGATLIFEVELVGIK